MLGFLWQIHEYEFNREVNHRVSAFSQHKKMFRQGRDKRMQTEDICERSIAEPMGDWLISFASELRSVNQLVKGF